MLDGQLHSHLRKMERRIAASHVDYQVQATSWKGEIVYTPNPTSEIDVLERIYSLSFNFMEDEIYPVLIKFCREHGLEVGNYYIVDDSRPGPEDIAPVIDLVPGKTTAVPSGIPAGKGGDRYRKRGLDKLEKGIGYKQTRAKKSPSRKVRFVPDISMITIHRFWF